MILGTSLTLVHIWWNQKLLPKPAKGYGLILVSFSQPINFGVYKNQGTGVISLGLGQPTNFPPKRSNV